MVNPVTLTASIIADLAFKKFLESSAGELGKKFTVEAIAKMDALRKKLWERLRDRSPELDEALVQIENGDRQALPTITKHLDVVMDEDEGFATEVKALAQEINAGKLQDNSNMTQNVTGDNNTNIQAKAEQGGTSFNAQNITVNNFPSAPSND